MKYFFKGISKALTGLISFEKDWKGNDCLFYTFYRWNDKTSFGARNGAIF